MDWIGLDWIGLDWTLRMNEIKVLMIWLGTFFFSPNWGFLKSQAHWAAPGLSGSELVNRPGSWQLLIIASACKASRKIAHSLGKAMGRPVAAKLLFVRHR